MENTYRQTLSADLAEVLASARRRAGSFRRVAKRAGISHGYLAMLCQGRRCPSPEVAERLIEALRLDRDEAYRLRYEAAQTAPAQRLMENGVTRHA